MGRLQRMFGSCALGILLIGLGACAQTGGIGDVLGGVLSPAPADQLSGTVQGVDTRSQQIFVRTQDGETIGIEYDSRTQVVYDRQNYPVTALERGDGVTLRIADSGNGYYTEYVRVDQPVNGSEAGGIGAGAYQTVEGTVRQVDTRSGWFTLATQYNGTIQVTLPYNPSSGTLDRFRDLRSGDRVRVAGTFVNSGRLELAEFR